MFDNAFVNRMRRRSVSLTSSRCVERNLRREKTAQFVPSKTLWKLLECNAREGWSNVSEDNWPLAQTSVAALCALAVHCLNTAAENCNDMMRRHLSAQAAGFYC